MLQYPGNIRHVHYMLKLGHWTPSLNARSIAGVAKCLNSGINTANSGVCRPTAVCRGINLSPNLAPRSTRIHNKLPPGQGQWMVGDAATELQQESERAHVSRGWGMMVGDVCVTPFDLGNSVG
jgi:hypothetical protein